MTERFSPEETAAALAQFDRAKAQTAEVPAETVTGGVVVENGDAGVAVQANKELGKGWSTQGEASWMTRAGYRLAWMFRWKKRES